MKLSQLKTNDQFLSDSNILFKVIEWTNYEIRAGKNKDRIKVQRVDTEEIYPLTDMIVRKYILKTPIN